MIFGDDVGEIGVGIDAAQFAGLDERGDGGPIRSTCVGTREERIFAIESNRTDPALDDIGVDLDAAIVEEACETLPA